MRLLAVDTALGACSVAVLDGTQVLAHCHVAMVRGHAEALAPMVDGAMRGANLAFAALERLAVTTGPGTFTGQRVGLAFVRALAVALKIPAVGITTLDAMAEEALRTDAALAVAVADAKRSEVYLGARHAAGTVIAPVLLARADAVPVIAAHAKGSVALAGSAAEAMAPMLRAEGLAAMVTGVRQPDAVFVGRLAARAAAPDHPPRPLYLRAPDAKLPAQALRKAPPESGA